METLYRCSRNHISSVTRFPNEAGVRRCFFCGEVAEVSEARLNAYQEATADTAIYPGAGTGLGFVYTALGMNGEAGEVAEHAKKMLRDDGGELTPTRRAQVIGELGDVLWYLARACTEVDVSLEDVAGANLAKLASRKKRGVLTGSGDTR